MSDADYSKKNKGVVSPTVQKYINAEQKSWLAWGTSYGLSWTQAQAVVPSAKPVKPIQDTTTTTSWYIPVQPTYYKENKDTPVVEPYDWVAWTPNKVEAPKSETPAMETPEEPVAPEEERIGTSKSEEQALQDSINKTQEEINNLKNREDALSQAEYLKKTKELQEYEKKQKEIVDKQKALTEEQTQIQSSVKLREAQRKLSQLKRNTAYLSSQGLWQSAESLDAFASQISNAEQVFKEMQQYEQYAEQMRKLWVERDSNAYERSMVELQDELDRNVSETIQTIFNKMSAEEMAWAMDTVEEVDKFAEQYFNTIDTNIANMTRKQIVIAEQKLALQTQTLERAREFVKNKGIVNKDMSIAQWYYVDWNGQPLISSTTGAPIPVPQDAPKEPVRDEKTGQLVTFSYDENWNIIADVQQVIDMPTFDSETINNLAESVKNGYMTVDQALDIVPQSWQSAFLAKVGSFWPKQEQEKVKPNERKYNKETGLYERTNAETGALETQSAPPVDTSKKLTGKEVSNTILSGNIDALAASMEEGVAYDCWDRNECWERYNDAVGGKNDTWVGNTYESKQQYIDYWVTQWQAGMWVVFNPWVEPWYEARSEYGHVWVLASWPYVRDGVAWYDVISSNYSTPWKLSKDFVPESLIASSGGGFVPTKAQEEAKEQANQTTIDEVISFNDDVTRRKMDKADVKRIGDMKQAVMSNKDSDINEIMRRSAGWKAIWETASKGLIKFDQALSQLDAVQKQISDMKTWPILGKIRSMNPYDTNAQVLKAQIQGLIPTIARGVYWEVGVLTDNDIRLYAQTLPNLKGTDAINKWVLAVTLDVLAWWYKTQLASLAWQGYDVSWMVGIYENIKWQADVLRNELGIWGGTQDANNPLWLVFDDE